MPQGKEDARFVCLRTSPGFPQAFRLRPLQYHLSEKQGMEVPPYIDILFVPDHAPLRPWIFPVSPTQISKTNAGEPETHQEPVWSLQPSECPRFRNVFFEQYATDPHSEVRA